NAVDHLPAFPADVADPQVAGGRVEAHAPGVAETVRPNLGARLRRLEEGVVRRHGIRFSRIFLVHVDAQNGTEQIADVLAGVESVGRVGSGAIAGGDVEAAVGAEVQVAAIVAACQ